MAGNLAEPDRSAIPHLIFHFFTEYNAPGRLPSGMLLACSNCGMNAPVADAVFNAAGKRFDPPQDAAVAPAAAHGGIGNALRNLHHV
jgi:hypothetical protein